MASPGKHCPSLTVGLPPHPPAGFPPRGLFCNSLALALLFSPGEEPVILETGPHKPVAETGRDFNWSAEHGGRARAGCAGDSEFHIP